MAHGTNGCQNDVVEHMVDKVIKEWHFGQKAHETMFQRGRMGVQSTYLYTEYSSWET